MEFTRFYVVLLRKGPAWTPESTPALEELQKRHLAHLTALHESGRLALAGPTLDHGPGDIRGISIFPCDVVGSLESLQALVEADPAFQAGRLRADYLTWHVAKGAVIGLPGADASTTPGP